MDDPFAYCEELVRTADRDRYLASLFAPEKQRRALFALYAFNIETARIREVVHERMAGEVRLQWWLDAVSGSGHGDVRGHPVAAALFDAAIRYRWPPAVLSAFVEARFFDLGDEPMPALFDLEGYAAATFSALILLAAQTLNDGRPPDIATLAEEAGAAQAIAGLLRAFPAHAARRQCYLPLDVLERHGVGAEEAFVRPASAGLRAAMAELRIRARAHLDAARNAAATVPETVLPALLPVALTRPLLDRMDGRRYDPFIPIEIAPWRRQWRIWRAARNAIRIF